MFFLRYMRKILTQMKKYLVELMNRLPHFITKSIDRYDELIRVMNSFSFF